MNVSYPVRIEVGSRLRVRHVSLNIIDNLNSNLLWTFVYFFQQLSWRFYPQGLEPVKALLLHNLMSYFTKRRILGNLSASLVAEVRTSFSLTVFFESLLVHVVLQGAFMEICVTSVARNCGQMLIS